VNFCGGWNGAFGEAAFLVPNVLARGDCILAMYRDLGGEYFSRDAPADSYDGASEKSA
jgi:hypothetical protein